jgi:DNA-binding NtrC family response regulator
MSEPLGYSDLDQYGLDIKALQKIDATPSMKGKSIYIQYITVNAGNEFDNIIAMIRQYGGVQKFIKALYLYVIERHDGNLAKAADDLRIPRQTLSEFRKRLLSE